MNPKNARRMAFSGLVMALLSPLAAGANPFSGCTDCVQVIVKEKGDLVYDPFFGGSVAERPPVPIASDTCIERDYFDRCLRNASQAEADDVYVRTEEGKMTRTKAIGARVVPGNDVKMTRSPGK